MDEQKLVKQTLDQIPQANPNAKHIIGLVKEGGRITGYQLSDNSIVEKQQAVGISLRKKAIGLSRPFPVPNRRWRCAGQTTWI